MKNSKIVRKNGRKITMKRTKKPFGKNGNLSYKIVKNQREL